MLSATELYKLKDKTIGEKVKWLRENKSKDDNGNYCSLTSQELAEQLGFGSSSTINRLEKGCNCNLSTLIDVADYYEVSIDWLLSRPNVGEAYCDLKSVCEYTGLSVDTVDYISDKNTSYNFKLLIEFIVAYAKENYMFINSLNLVKSSAKTYQAQILTEKALMRVYEANGEISDDIKSALYDVYKNDSIKLNDKEKMKIFAFLKNNYIADKYELSEIIKNILNEYSVSGLYADNYDEYTFQDLKNDEKELGNSNYFYNMAKSLKEGETNEEKES